MERPGDKVVSFSGVEKRYGAVTALDGVDLTVRTGGVTAILGPNGAGKSTAVGLMLGRLRPDRGTVQLFGLPPQKVAARRRVGVMLQTTTLPPQLTVREQVSLFAGYYPDPMDVAEALALAGLDGLATRRCQALSGGQQRRVQFALAIIGRPALLVLDEPTVGLDLESRRALWSTVRLLAGAGTAVILTTHHLEEADALADRVVLIDRGRIMADDTVANIKALVAARTIRCRTALGDDRLSHLPGVRSLRRAGAHVLLGSVAAEATLRALFDADPDLSDLIVSGASLEEAFDLLTGRTPLATPPAAPAAAA